MTPWPWLFLALSQQRPDTVPVELGRRVRIETSAAARQPFTGWVHANDSGRVKVATEGGTALSVPLTNIAVFSVSRGRNAARGLGIGALAGLLTGAFVYSSAPRPGIGDDPLGLDSFLLKLFSFGVTPTAGAIVGMLTAREQWTLLALGAGPPAAKATQQATARQSTMRLYFAPTERLRVTTRSQRVHGMSTDNSPDTLSLTTSGGTLMLPWLSITDVQVRRGRQYSRGAMIGLAVGLLCGVIAQGTAPSTDVAVAYTSAAIVGAGVGALLFSPSRWESLPLPVR